VGDTMKDAYEQAIVAVAVVIVFALAFMYEFDLFVK
jgi:hypothetical protein